ERRRDEIREARRAAMRPPAGGGSAESGAAAGAAPSPGRWGESLRFAAAGDGRELAATVEVSAEDLGPLVQLPPELVARQYVCPTCVTALWVEVVPADMPAWRDFTLH